MSRRKGHLPEVMYFFTVFWAIIWQLLHPETEMTDTASHRITLLLGEWGNGEDGALEELMPLVYDELRKLAAARLAL